MLKLCGRLSLLSVLGSVKSSHQRNLMSRTKAETSNSYFITANKRGERERDRMQFDTNNMHKIVQPVLVGGLPVLPLRG